MSIKFALKNYLSLLIGRVCEQSSFVRSIARRLDFADKLLVVGYIRPQFLPQGELEVLCLGLNYRLNLSDDIQRSVYFNSYESESLREALTRIPIHAEAICFDVGANIGFYSLQFANKLKTGTVYSFEPDPSNYKRLVDNIALNGFNGMVKPYMVGISNHSGSETLHRSDSQHSGWGSLEKFGDICVSETEVTVNTLDEFLATEGISRINLLKVDVEAHEFQLLEGARETLKNHVCDAIMIEFNGPRLAERGKTFKDFLNIFQDNQYQLTGDLELVKSVESGIVDPTTVCFNLMFVSSSLVTQAT